MKDTSYLVDDFNQVYLHNASQEVMDLYKNIKPYSDHTVEEEDNRGNIIRRPLFSHSSLPESQWLDLKEINVKDFDWSTNTSYITLLHHHSELAVRNLDLIPEYILDYIRKEKCKLVLDNTLEGDSVDNFLPILYDSVDSLKLPPSKIYYVTNNLLAEEMHDQYKKYNIRKEYVNVISLMWNVIDIQRLIRKQHLPEVVDVQEEIDYKKSNLKDLKHFLKVNRTDREQRNLMMLFLNKYGIIKKSLISFPSWRNLICPERNHLFGDILDKKNIESLKKQVPFDIDQTDKDNHGEAGFGIGNFNADLPFQPVHYKNSFVSIVMGAFPESQRCCHLHSSTFNPIYCGQPIIQYGPYKALAEMKKRGFKTFSKWWDESYDEIEHCDDRLKAVMKLILEVSKKTKEEMLEMYIDMKPVLEHNIKLIKDYDLNTELKWKIYEQ